MKFSEVKFPIIATAFVIVGLVADFLPHPALGPGVIRSVLALTFREPDTDIPVTDLNSNESVDYANQDMTN